FVFAGQNREEHFTSRSRQSKRRSAAQDLKNREKRQQRHETDGDKSNHAERRHQNQSRSDPKPFQQTASQKKLPEQRKRIHGEIEPGQKCSADDAIVNLETGQIG